MVLNKLKSNNHKVRLFEIHHRKPLEKLIDDFPIFSSAYFMHLRKSAHVKVDI